MKIISYIQSSEGQINNNSLEAFAAAQKICSENNGQIYLLTFDKEAANKLTSYKSDGIILMSNDLLKDYNPIYFFTLSREYLRRILSRFDNFWTHLSNKRLGP